MIDNWFQTGKSLARQASLSICTRSTPIMTVISELKHRFASALEAALGAEFRAQDPVLVSTSNPKFGDYQANFAMGLSKQLAQPPRQIAQAVLDRLDVSDLCETPSIAGPGFINLMLKRSYLEGRLHGMQGDDRLGIPKVTKPQRVIVDYPSPNIAKEMHVGHLRPAVIGECFARILEFQGHDVLKLSHVGDWGTPFGMLIAHLQSAYPEALASDELNVADLATFYREAKKRFDSDEVFQTSARQAVVLLQAGDGVTLKAWRVVCALSKRSYRKIYDALGIAADIVDRGESFYNPYLADVVTALRASGLLVEDQGAQCVFLEGFSNKEGKPLPLIVQKSDGGYNYATTDLAAIRYRINEDRADRLVYTTDVGQTNHFIQVFQVAKRAGWISAEVTLEHAPFGLVLGADGKRIKSRDGESVPLQELLDEAVERTRSSVVKRLEDEERSETPEWIDNVAQVVGLGAVKYADLSQNRNSNYIFDYDRMLALQGNTAPYMLYVYARVQSIGRKGELDLSQLETAAVSLAEADEVTLAKHLLLLQDTIDAVAADLLPNRLAQYLFELAQKFNVFFENCPVLKAEPAVKTSRLVLCDLTARTMKIGLDLLGISVLDRM
jgi:arginyl-tRNA synthetase